MRRTESSPIALLLLYTGASFLHFAHNAEFLGEYPNLPDFITRSSVYVAWLGLAAIGAAGFALHRAGWKLTGLLLLGLYAGLGFAGLLHYARAPVGAHSATMNFTIWLEVVSACGLLCAVAKMLARSGGRRG